jgi:toxin ParE1/3/4
MGERSSKIIWSPEAIADLDDIWDFHEQAAGVRTAENMLRRIQEGCEFLREFPLGGRERRDVRSGLRSFSIVPFVIFYQLEHADRLEIMHVLDGRQDVDAAFDD